MSNENDLKDGIGVYCKCGCGGIIYVVTNEGYERREAKKEIDNYFDNGYTVGRVSKKDVKELFGCKNNLKHLLYE